MPCNYRSQGVTWQIPITVGTRSVILPGASVDPRKLQVEHDHTGGTFTLSYGPYVTTALAFDAAGATVEAALASIVSPGPPTVGLVATVTKPAAKRFIIDLTDWSQIAEAGPLPLMMGADFSSLTGGTDADLWSRVAWVSSGVIESISIQGERTTPAAPMVRIYNTIKANGRPFYSLTPSPTWAAGAVGDGVLVAQKTGLYHDAPAGHTIPPTFEVRWDDDGLGDIVANGLIWEESGYSAQADPERFYPMLECPYGQVVTIESTAGAEAYTVSIHYQPWQHGWERMKNDARAKQSGRFNPVIF